MNKDSIGKNSIKKALIASLFASVILGAEKSSAVENESYNSESKESIENHTEVSDKTLAVLKDFDLSKATTDSLHIAIRHHLSQEYIEALDSYNTILDSEEISEEWIEALQLLIILADLEVDLLEINLEEQAFNEYRIENKIVTDLIDALKIEESTVVEDELILEEEQEESDEPVLEETTEDDHEDSVVEEPQAETDEENEETEEASENKDEIEGDSEDDLDLEGSFEEEDDISEGEEILENEENIENIEESKEESSVKKEEVQSFSTFSINTRQAVPTATNLYNRVVNADTASNAWHYATELLKHYPNDYRVSEAFEIASNRIFSLGQSNHRNRNFNTANIYYRQLLNHKFVPSEIQVTLQHLIQLASNSTRIEFANTYYQNVITANTASEAWNAALEFKSVYPTDNRISDAIDAAGQRIYAMGRSSQRANRFSQALGYYNLLLNEPLISSELRDDLLVNVSVINVELSTSESDLFYNTINASTATEAWNNLEKLIARNPNHNRIDEAVAHASARVYSMGRSNHIAGRNSNATTYYQWLLQHNRVEQSLKNTVSGHLNQLDKGYAFRTAEDYYHDTLNAASASEAWNIATEGLEVFNNNIDIQTALNDAAARNYSLAQSNHRRNNFNTAITYYNRLIDHNSVHLNIRKEAEIFRNQALSKLTLTTANQFASQSLNAGTASEAWRIANDGLKYFPSNGNITSALNASGERILALGESNHKRGNFSAASTYYTMLLNNNQVMNSLHTRAEAYSYLASNKLYPANTIIRETKYSTSFEAAVNRQMALGHRPQMSHNGGWRDATREEVIQNMDPKNSLPADTSDLSGVFTTARIITDVLNVRTGPGTGFERIGTATRGQEYTIIEEQNGWFKIGFEGTSAWISGATNFVDANRSMLQHLVLTGASGVSLNNLNRELNGAGILHQQGAAFQKASRDFNINEIYLISHAFLETGRGTSTLARGVLVDEVNGQKVTPRIVYNMYGIGAVDHAPIRLGAERAYTEGWFTPEDSIYGGAKWISEMYVNHSSYQQNTLYKMRWNPINPGTHQYATDVGWAQKQTSMLSSLIYYSQQDNLILNFDIPKY